VFCASEGGEAEVLEGQGMQLGQALLAAGVLEGVQDLLGGGSWVDVAGAGGDHREKRDRPPTRQHRQDRPAPLAQSSQRALGWLR
jgi:hypothetical protein